MRASTKLKSILMDNTVTLSMNERGEWEGIVTNNETGDSHICTGGNLSTFVERAYRDTNKAARYSIKHYQP